jgi:tRNA (Thr-GGU) A37 N-methylase
VALAVTRITTLDAAQGRVGVEALDAFDGTPLLDIKPWLPSVDVPPPA